ncbi:hypothetical protein DESA109040_09330 [Deinococcus saxicola]
MTITELSNLPHPLWTELLSTARHTLPTQLLSRLDRRFTVTLDIQGDDPAFPWLAAWLAATCGTWAW